MIVLYLLCPSVACAQVVSLGYKVGVNFAFPGPDTLFTSVKQGLMLGGVIVVQPTRQLTFQAELLYSERVLAREFESREDVEGLPALVETEDRFTLRYLEVPVAGGITLPLGQMPIRLHGVMGLSFAFQVGCTRNFERRGFDLTSGQQVVLAGLRNLPCPRGRRRDLAFLFGAGLEFTVKGTRLVIEARYTRDLVSSGASFFGVNRIFTLSVGPMFLAVPR